MERVDVRVLISVVASGHRSRKVLVEEVEWARVRDTCECVLVSIPSLYVQSDLGDMTWSH